MSKFVKSIGAKLRLFYLLALPARGISKDPTVWLDVASHPLSTFSKII